MTIQTEFDQFISEMELQFTRSPWSQRLPLTLELDTSSYRIPTFQLEVFQYGRDFFERKMEHTALSEAIIFDWAGELYTEEHPNEKPPEKSVYEDQAGYFRLRIEPPPGSAEVLMTANSVAGALDPVNDLMTGPEPHEYREIGAFFLDKEASERRVLATIYITIIKLPPIDPDEPDRLEDRLRGRPLGVANSTSNDRGSGHTTMRWFVQGRECRIKKQHVLHCILCYLFMGGQLSDVELRAELFQVLYAFLASSMMGGKLWRS